MVIRPTFGGRRRWRRSWRIADAPLVFVDLETTGLHPQRGQKIVEAAFVDRGGVRFHWSASDGDPSAISPDDERAVLREARAVLEEAIVVGHNVVFDLRFLAERGERAGFALPEATFIDTLQMARKLTPDTADDARLATVAGRLGLDLPETLHRAVPDARLARDVFDAMVERVDLETLADLNLRRLAWHGG